MNSMNAAAATPEKPAWTLADFLCSYRFWALFLSSFLVAASQHAFMTMLPLISMNVGSTHQMIGLYYFGSTGGWVIGAFLAFFVASRTVKPALIVPAVVCMAITACLLPMQDLFASPFFLLLLGLANGAVMGVFLLASVIALIGGRPAKIDFACLFTLLSTPTIAGAFAPAVAGQFYAIGGSALIVLAFLLCLLCAILLIVPAKNLSFEEAPRHRHAPLAPRRRSPVLVALVLLAAQIVTILSVVCLYGLLLGQVGYGSPIVYMVSPVIFCLSLLGIIYLAYWVYRIHGELAGAQASPRLADPLNAMLTALFIPLGLPVLLMTLADLLNDRAAVRGQGRFVSIVWLAIWSFFLPPIAIALVQHGANRSYRDTDGG
jgi:MFS transporter, DHA1 family, inner membrane transport protein